jgi:hypothetical protein
MKRIPLTQNRFAIVDDEDFEELSSNPDHQSQNHLGFPQRATELVLAHARPHGNSPIATVVGT